MSVTIEFSKTLPSKSQAIIVPFYFQDEAVTYVSPMSVPGELKTHIDRVLAEQGDKGFEANNGQVLSFYVTQPDVRQIVLLGLGDHKDSSAGEAEEAGGLLYAALAVNGSIKHAAILGNDLVHAEALLLGVSLRSYRFDRYKTNKKSDDDQATIVTYVADDTHGIQDDFTAYQPTLSGVFLARDLVNEAPNALYPDSYAERIKDELKPLGVEVEILDEKKMLKMGMGAIMAVGQGSAYQPRMVIMHWRGKNADKTKQPVALVGKGVTFDTGGISIKPSAGMDEMKMDMGGSAAVVGAMKVIAARKSKAEVIGIVGLAENMPSSNAYRPGDIIKSYAGKTIEVLNTDAEGRLVLADALSYVQEQYNPSTIIDLATLTGAMMVALGNEYCGTFVNEDVLWEELLAASKNANEKLWRMPLDEVWSKEMKSDVADLRNIGKSRFAGASTAAEFLHHFIDDGRKWAHMDIAGTAWIKSNKPTVPKYGVGFGVRTLDQLVQHFYERD